MCSGESDWTCLQPGFPIRKSSDHSLVIDSPRLIADSYVLLRFLVPRHPPCALKNLMHKDLRCSRPLCSSQHTGGPTARLGAYTTTTTPTRGPAAARCGSHVTGVLTSQPAGPRGACARTLRTQQRVKRQPPTPPAFHGSHPPPKKERAPPVLATRRERQRQLIDVPPLSTRCPTRGDKPGPGPRRTAASAP